MRTSNDPLIIDPVSAFPGLIGLTFAPGKKQRVSVSGPHERDLDTDLDAIKAWGAVDVLTLVEDFELVDMEITGIGKACAERGIAWHFMPIRDVSVPGSVFTERWPRMSDHLRRQLDHGERILVHCRGGLGRAGMIAARLLVETGISAPKAIHLVREARPGAIETRAQERWVRDGGEKPKKRRSRMSVYAA